MICNLVVVGSNPTRGSNVSSQIIVQGYRIAAIAFDCKSNLFMSSVVRVHLPLPESVVNGCINIIFEIRFHLYLLV